MELIHKRDGFTLVELILSLAIMAILAALAAPMFGSDDALQLDVAKRLLVSDLEYTQVLAIANPEDNIALIIEENGTGWHIAQASSQSIPLNDRITGEALVTTLGQGPAASANQVRIESNAQDNIILFDQNGGLVDFSQEILISLTIGETNALIQISPTTGSIQ